MPDADSLKLEFTPKEAKALSPPVQLCAARFAPFGNQLFACGYDGLVRRWMAAGEGWQEMPALEGHSGWATEVAFHPVLPLAFTVDSWGCLQAWDCDAEPPRSLWRVSQAHDGWIRALDVSPSGELAATAGRDRTVRLWRTNDGRQELELAGHLDDVYAVRFSPDGQRLATGDWQGFVKLWELATGRCLRELDCRKFTARMQIQDVGGVRALCFDEAGRILACGGMQPSMGANVQGVPTLLFFDVESGGLARQRELGPTNDGYVFDIARHQAGFWLVVTSGGPGNGKLHLLRAEDETPFFSSPTMANCHSVSLAPDKKRFAVSATNRGSDGNGRPLKDGKYPRNASPVHLWRFG